MWPKIIWTKELREKAKLAAFKRDNTKRIASLPKGKNHWRWNDNPSIAQLHERIRKKHGNAKTYRCAGIKCRRMAHDWASKSGRYTDNVDDYEPLCRSCHVIKDKNWIRK